MTTKRARLHRRLSVLGPFTFIESGRRISVRPSARRLLALLAIKNAMARYDAAAVLWTDLSQQRAMGNLRTVLWRLRRDAAGVIVEDDDVLRLEDHVHVDLHEVQAWAWRVLKNEEPWTPVPPGAVRDLLPGWGDPWLVELRDELRLMEMYALEAVAQRLMLKGRFGVAASLVRAAVRIDPLRESTNRLLIEIYLRDGNRSDALHQYRRFEKCLRVGLNAEPAPGLAALVGSFAPSLSRASQSRDD